MASWPPATSSAAIDAPASAPASKTACNASWLRPRCNNTLTLPAYSFTPATWSRNPARNPAPVSSPASLASLKLNASLMPSATFLPKSVNACCASDNWVFASSNASVSLVFIVSYNSLTFLDAPPAPPPMPSNAVVTPSTFGFNASACPASRAAAASSAFIAADTSSIWRNKLPKRNSSSCTCVRPSSPNVSPMSPAMPIKRLKPSVKP